MFVKFCVIFVSISVVFSAPLTNIQAEAVDYLLKYGYINQDDKVSNLIDKNSFIDSIKAVQRMGGLEETGVMDKRTLELMRKPRCGNPDVINHQRFKRYVLKHDHGWEKRSITYYLENWTRELGQSAAITNIQKALDEWGHYGRLTFTRSSSPNADIILKFVSRIHGDGHDFDGPGNVLAHAYAPIDDSIGGDVHFDNAEIWVDIQNQPNGRLHAGQYDFYPVALHELGHSMGLAHSLDKSAVMYPLYQETPSLSYDDIQGMSKLYLERTLMSDNVPPPPPPTPPPPPAPPAPPPPPRNYPWKTQQNPPQYDYPRTDHRNNDGHSYNRQSYGSRDFPTLSNNAYPKISKVNVYRPVQKSYSYGGSYSNYYTRRPSYGDDSKKNYNTHPNYHTGHHINYHSTTLPNHHQSHHYNATYNSNKSNPKNQTIWMQGRKSVTRGNKSRTTYNTTYPNTQKKNFSRTESDKSRNEHEKIDKNKMYKPPKNIFNESIICDGRIDTIVMWRGILFVFIGEDMWAFRKGKQLVEGFPLKISYYFPTFPKSIKTIDAAYEKPNGNLVLFSGNTFWEHNGRQFLSNNFKTLDHYGLSQLTSIDDVVSVKKNNEDKTVFFKNNKYWIYNEYTQSLENPHPAKIEGLTEEKVVDTVAIGFNGKPYLSSENISYEIDTNKMAVKRLRMDVRTAWFGCTNRIESGFHSKLISQENKGNFIHFNIILLIISLLIFGIIN